MRRVMLNLIGMFGLVVGLSVGQAGCTEQATDGQAAEPMLIAVSIPPLAWVAQGLAPEGAQVAMLVPPGASPHGWETTPEQALALASADLVLMVGLNMEPSIERVVTGEARVLRFVDAVGIDGEQAQDHSSGRGHAHSIDPHLWLDPSLMEQFVRATHDRLAAMQEARGALDAVERARLAVAMEAMLVEVDRVRGVGELALGAHEGAGMVTVHDAWSRFAGAFGVRVAGVLQRSNELEPSPGAVAESAALVIDGGAGVIVIEAQFDDALARRVARETGAVVTYLDPLGGGEWPAMMTANIEALAAAFAEASASAPAGAGAGG